MTVVYILMTTKVRSAVHLYGICPNEAEDKDVIKPAPGDESLPMIMISK